MKAIRVNKGDIMSKTETKVQMFLSDELLKKVTEKAKKLTYKNEIKNPAAIEAVLIDAVREV